jgi:hypothetical protein
MHNVSTVSGETATPEELNARRIKGVKPLFLPSATLKRNLERITFEVPGRSGNAVRLTID